MEDRLYRSRTSRIIAGVCGGVGEYLHLDPVIVRVLFVLLALVKGLAVVAYLVAWVLVPQREAGAPAPAASEHGAWQRYLPGLILIGVGAFLLMRQHVWWFEIEEMWPVLLVLGGMVLVYGGFRAHQRRLMETTFSGSQPTSAESHGGQS